jgi:hypothetical protein
MSTSGDDQPPAAHPDGVPSDAEDDPGWPWSFILLVVAGALYLIFRFVELGIKLFT